MEHLSVKKAINLARNFGAAGVLAAALVMTSGCSQADDHQTAVQVADSDNAQEDGVYRDRRKAPGFIYGDIRR